MDEEEERRGKRKRRRWGRRERRKVRKERRERKSSEKGRNKRERKCRRKKERREGVKVRKRRWRQSKQKEEGGGLQPLPASCTARPSSPCPRRTCSCYGHGQSGHLRNGAAGPEPAVPGQRPASGHRGSRGTGQRPSVFADPRSDQHHGVPSSRFLATRRVCRRCLTSALLEFLW